MFPVYICLINHQILSHIRVANKDLIYPIKARKHVIHETVTKALSLGPAMRP